ncbi:MAG: PilZ domain-containing protein [Spirochaetales bacterium]|nr:PilZ domain-containing protein [Spirochaetales bacterium]
MQPIRSWNQENVDQLFSSLSGGIRPASPLEILGLFAGLVLVLLLLIRLDQLRRQSRRKRLIQHSRLNFEAMVEERKITASEIDLLQKIVAFTPDPEISLSLLCREEQTFYLALRQYLNSQAEAERMARTPQLARLIYRLDFPPRKDGLEAFTSIDLPPGTVFYRDNQQAGRLQSQTAEYFVLQMSNPLSGEAAIHRTEGRYTLQLMPLGESRYQHTLLWRAPQRRAHVRFPLSIPATYNRERVELINVSAGGALISGSETAADGSLRFTLQGSSFLLEARVVSISRHGIHLQFKDGQMAITDRLFRNLIRGKP